MSGCGLRSVECVLKPLCGRVYVKHARRSQITHTTETATQQTHTLRRGTYNTTPETQTLNKQTSYEKKQTYYRAHFRPEMLRHVRVVVVQKELVARGPAAREHQSAVAGGGCQRAAELRVCARVPGEGGYSADCIHGVGVSE